jgi:hypothetical protein
MLNAFLFVHSISRMISHRLAKNKSRRNQKQKNHLEIHFVFRTKSYWKWRMKVKWCFISYYCFIYCSIGYFLFFLFLLLAVACWLQNLKGYQCEICLPTLLTLAHPPPPPPKSGSWASHIYIFYYHCREVSEHASTLGIIVGLWDQKVCTFGFFHEFMYLISQCLD